MQKYYINSNNSDSALDERLKNSYSKEEITSILAQNKRLIEHIRAKLELNDKDIISILQKQQEINLPISIFKSRLSTLEIVVKFLKEVQNKTFEEIAGILNRDHRTIWHAYKRTQLKDITLNITESKFSVPVSIFQDRQNAPLEAIVKYLKESQKLRFCDISRFLDRSAQTIWTIYKRVNIKQEAKKKDSLIVYKKQPISFLDKKVHDKFTRSEIKAIIKENQILQEILRSKSKLSKKELRDVLYKSEEINLPVSIFKNKLSTLEIIVKYLKDELGLTFADISKAINRDHRTIWHAYKRAQIKNFQLNVTQSSISIPLILFSNRKNAPLETIVKYLKENSSLRLIDISRLLQRSPKTIWTVYNRSKAKHAK